jgi:hypothetical protein
MRTLKFIIDGQIITPDPNCDFSGLVPGTEGYIQASFSFSSEWKGCAKVAGFYSMMGEEYEPQNISDGQTCMIPPEALARQKFKIRVIGRRRDGLKLTTNKATVSQRGANT